MSKSPAEFIDALPTATDWNTALCNFVPKNPKEGEYLFGLIQKIVGMTDAVKLCTSEKGDQAWDMHKAGTSPREIAIWLGWSPPAFTPDDFKKAVEKTVKTCKFVPYSDWKNRMWCKKCGTCKSAHSS